MRILLDEDLDVRFRLEFGAEHVVETVEYRGWKGLTNSRLLTAASRDFDLLITADDSLPDQQNLAEYAIAVVVLRPRSKALPHLRELLPEIERILPGVEPGSAIRVLPPRG